MHKAVKHGYHKLHEEKAKLRRRKNTPKKLRERKYKKFKIGRGKNWKKK